MNIFKRKNKKNELKNTDPISYIKKEKNKHFFTSSLLYLMR